MTDELFDEVSKRLYLLDGGATLVFTIDSTTSMRLDIGIAKNIATQILDLERKSSVDYMLADINDPGMWYSVLAINFKKPSATVLYMIF